MSCLTRSPQVFLPLSQAACHWAFPSCTTFGTTSSTFPRRPAHPYLRCTSSGRWKPYHHPISWRKNGIFQVFCCSCNFFIMVLFRLAPHDKSSFCNHLFWQIPSHLIIMVPIIHCISRPYLRNLGVNSQASPDCGTKSGHGRTRWLENVLAIMAIIVPTVMARNTSYKYLLIFPFIECIIS